MLTEKKIKIERMQAFAAKLNNDWVNLKNPEKLRRASLLITRHLKYFGGNLPKQETTGLDYDEMNSLLSVVQSIYFTV